MPQLCFKELDELKYFLKNIHSWRKFYTVAGCSGCAKSQLCCKVLCGQLFIVEHIKQPEHIDAKELFDMLKVNLEIKYEEK